MSSVQSVAARASRPLARAVLSILLFSLLVVACQPSNCQTTSTTARITCSGTSPGDSCPAPMVRTCVKQCRAVAGEGQACLVNPCDPAEGKICDRNLACVPDSAGSSTGKCGPALAECDPNAAASDTNRCQAGTHCIPYVEVAGAPQGKRAACAIPEIFHGNPPKGMCMPFIPEGEMCDSDARPGETLPLDEVDCRPCEPGTTCVRPAG